MMRFAIAALLVTLFAAPAFARGHASSSKHSSNAGHEHAVPGEAQPAPPPGHETSRYEKSVKSSERAYDKPNVKALNRAIQAPVAASDKGTAGKNGGERGAAGVNGAAAGSVKGGGK
jgi:hypothetical protein